MHEARPKELSTRSLAAVVLALAMGAAAALPSGPLQAQATSHTEHKVVRRPVVVVGDSDGPVFTWSLHGSRAFLGVQTIELTAELRQHFSVPDDAGVMISKTTPEGPAETSGVRVGDILTRVDDRTVTSPSELAATIGAHEVDDVVVLELWRDGKVRKLEATLAERESAWVDIRQFHPGEHGIGLHELQAGELQGAIELETETLNRAIERLNETMGTPEWHERIHSFQEHQGLLMERIETLEKRLKELERELESLPREP